MMKWLEAFDTNVAREYYILPLECWEYKWTMNLDRIQLWNFIRSLSYINKLSDEEKEVVRCVRLTDNRRSRVS